MACKHEFYRPDKQLWWWCCKRCEWKPSTYGEWVNLAKVEQKLNSYPEGPW